MFNAETKFISKRRLATRNYEKSLTSFVDEKIFFIEGEEDTGSSVS